MAVSVQSNANVQQQQVDPSLTAHELALVAGDFVNTGLGAHRVFQTITTSAKWVEQADPKFFGKTSQSILNAVKLGDNVGMVPKLINQTGRAMKALEAYNIVKAAPQVKDESISSKLYGFLIEVNEWIGDFAKVLMIGIPSSAPLQVVSNATDLVLDGRDYQESTKGIDKNDIELARLKETAAPERDQRLQVEEKRGHMLKIAKSVFSFVGNFFALLGVIFGVALLPSLIVLTISTAHLFFALWNRFYVDTMTHKLEDRLRERQIKAMSA